MAKLNRKSAIGLGLLFLFIGLLMVVTIGSKDSELNQTERALEAFRGSLPADLLQTFDGKDYAKATEMLKGYTSKVKEYAKLFPLDKRVHFLKAEYEMLDAETLAKIPDDIKIFWKKYYGVLDAECIQGFSDSDVIEFMRQSRVETIEKIKAGTYKPYLN